MNILITGVLGYIGRELCEIYKDTGYNIIGIDSNFIPDKVAWLKKNNIKFYHRDLFKLDDILPEADIIFHCAGITSVPQTKEQSNDIIDAEITRVGTEGTRYVVSKSKKDCTIVFLSTHVIFEGITNTLNNIEEKFQPCPVLAYGKSKYQSEIDILDSGKNFIIARLASVYGYNSCIRWRILPNLFSKMVSMNENLNVFGCDNIKPLIGVKDVAASLKFLLDSRYKNEIFNLSNESLRVIEIAETCKKYNPDIVINVKNDATINNGYNLSNKKLLSTGYKFSSNIEDEIQNMISLWKYR